jgi:hypothetical protein
MPFSQATDLILQVMAEEATEVRCVGCGAAEFLFSLDEPLDAPFIANYHCDECEDAERTGQGVAE